MKKFAVGFLMSALLTTMACRKAPSLPKDSFAFENKLATLIDRTMGNAQKASFDIAPVAVISQNAIQGSLYTRLDELICKRLEDRLSDTRQVISFSRENWFEFRESKPLSSKGHPPALHGLMNHIIIFIVKVDQETLFDRIKVTITAKDSKMLPIHAIKERMYFKHADKRPATLLLSAGPMVSPYPKGLEKNPYVSLEEMAYNLASELGYALKKGIKLHDILASNKEIQIVLCSNPSNRFQSGFHKALTREMQQALVSMEGINAAVSQEDFNFIFSQIDFYSKNQNLFEADTEKLIPGSVLLMAETKNYKQQHQVSLRAIWRVTPLSDQQGDFIPENSSGMYLSGFTASAWFAGSIPGVVEATPFHREKKLKPSSNRGFD